MTPQVITRNVRDGHVVVTFDNPLKVVGDIVDNVVMVVYAESFVTHKVREGEIVLIGSDAFCVDHEQGDGLRSLPAWKQVTGLHCPN